MLVGTQPLNYMELLTNLSTMPMLAAKAVSKILLLKGSTLCTVQPILNQLRKMAL